MTLTRTDDTAGATAAPERPEMKLDWVNILFLAATHLLALTAVAYGVFVRFSWWTVGLAALWMFFCGVSITGGYHRLFAHPTYRCIPALRLFYLLFGAASVQNSALRWASDHRMHHGRTDQPEDPYNIRRGFWWAHIGWVFFKSPPSDFKNARDLLADPLVRFQDRFYVPLALVFGGLLPMLIALAWGDPVGALLMAGFLRLALQYHATFSVNSLAHLLGRQPYSTSDSARDSFVTAIVTLGEGYHNYHHRFPADYRNGVRPWHFDPTKWWVWTLSKIGVTRDLKRVPDEMIRRAREAVRNRSEEAEA
jgi:stearoyl-CoA desaturase (delta-9 desaturase)